MTSFDSFFVKLNMFFFSKIGKIGQIVEFEVERIIAKKIEKSVFFLQTGNESWHLSGRSLEIKMLVFLAKLVQLFP